jgi:hypothetical protein
LHGGTFASNVNSKHGNVFYSPRNMNNAAGAQAVPGALARHYPERDIVAHRVAGITCWFAWKSWLPSSQCAMVKSRAVRVIERV